MQKITGNEPAMPTRTHDDNGHKYKDAYTNGINIIQYFASVAEISWDVTMNTLNIRGFKDNEITLEMIAAIRAEYKCIEAKALIAELNKEK